MRFLDLAKGPHHGERYRHDAVHAARSDAIFYLCDDDLLLPDHVADLLALLEGHTFVAVPQRLRHPDGDIGFYADDLADPKRSRCTCARPPATTPSASPGPPTRGPLRGGRPTLGHDPRGRWPDHYQFRKLMRDPACRGDLAPDDRPAVADQLDGRDAWSAAERVDELLPWHALVTSPGAQEHIDRLYAERGRRDT